MLTVKLKRGNTTKIVEAIDVEIQAAGVPEPLPPEAGESNRPLPLTNRARAIYVTLPNGKQSTYHIAESETACPGVVDMWDCAYIENAQGQTTERVYAYAD